ENVLMDCIRGCFVVACTLCAFISLVWLREQIVLNGGPEWLHQQIDPIARLPGHLFDGQQGGDQAGEDGDQNGANPDQAEAGVQANAEDIDDDDNDANQAMDNAVVNNDENNWNPVEWERAAEELTWERMLGLDGSLVFLEHVFWVVSLNTSFILVF
ncbi:E3 ubiquitin-protein ligase MARCH6, partial [Exaiptasia diaphana]